MTADIVFSLMLSELSELIPHIKSITSKTLPKPLSVVPWIIENTLKKKPELRFISFEKLVDCDEFFKHHYNREGGAGQEANKLQQSWLG